MFRVPIAVLCCLLATAGPAAEEAPAEEPTVTTPAIDATDFVLDEATGVWSCTLNRPGKGRRKKGKRVDLLLPDGFSADKSYRVLYLLSACGRLDPAIPEIQRVDAHNKHQLICVTPTMGGWYGNHATDPNKRPADFLMHQVVPLIESRYPVVEGKEGRILLGFSKSGWGALSLIFCYPDFFGYAGSWDAPLDWSLDSIPKLCGHSYGSLENYQRHHPQTAARRSAAHFQERCRIAVHGRKTWGKHGPPYHALLDELGIKHHWDDTKREKHSWDSGWVGPMIDALVAMTANNEGVSE